MKRLPAFRLIPEPLDDEAKAVKPSKWADPELGTRHQLGGEPKHFQNAETPRCSCQQPMTFYAQLDAINSENCEFDLADFGLIFVFVCFDCFETASVLQSY